MSLSDEERTTLAEVARGAAYRNEVREFEGKWIRGKLLGYFVGTLNLVVLLVLGMIMDNR